MIKIIKDGQKDFIANCSICGCEFSYQTEDIRGSSVACPCCGFYVSHSIKDNENDTIKLRWNSGIGNFTQFSDK